jgi:hypothetical protein
LFGKKLYKFATKKKATKFSGNTELPGITERYIKTKTFPLL